MIIMKFGGTSLANPEAVNRVIGIIKSEPRKKIVVVSAIAKTTRALTEIFSLALQKNQQYKKELEEIKKNHKKIIEELISNEDLSDKTKTKIDILFQELNKILESKTLFENHDQNMAKALSFGELLSSILMHTAMMEQNIKTKLIDARSIIITNDNLLQGSPNLESISKIAKKHLEPDETVVTQGFIASTETGKTTLLGLEGSDYSASILGMAIDAKEIQIWTDVDGIMTGDPKIIKNTKLIPQISFEEASLLSSLGAKIIHPKAVEPASQKNIPIKILNSLNPDAEGTMITNESNLGENQHLSITHKEDPQKDLVTINLVGKYDETNKKTLEDISKTLDGIDIKMVLYGKSGNSIVLHAEKTDLKEILQKLHDALI